MELKTSFSNDGEDTGISSSFINLTYSLSEFFHLKVLISINFSKTTFAELKMRNDELRKTYR
jgi:hypothetical protein